MNGIRPDTPRLLASPSLLVAGGAALVAGYVATLGARWGIAAILLFAICLVIMTRIVTVFELTVVTMPLMFHASAGGTVNLAVSDAFFPLLMITTVFQVRRSGIDRPYRQLVMGFSAITLLALVLSLVWRSLAHPIEVDVAAGIVATVKLGIGLGYLACTYFIVGTEHAAGKARYLAFWAWTSTVIAVATILDAVGFQTFVASVDGVRSSGTFEDPNLFGSYLICSLGVIWLAFVMRAISIYLAIAQSALIVLAALTTGSRATIAALAVMLLLAIILARKIRSKLLLSAISVISILGGAWMVADSGLFRSIRGLDRLVAASSDVESDVRFRLWDMALAEWNSSPFLGIGPGQFLAKYGILPHNTFLSFLAETGVIGFALLIAMVVATALVLWKRNPSLSTPALAGLAGTVVLMATLNLQNVRFIWVYLGICLACASWTRDQPRSPASLSLERSRP